MRKIAALTIFFILTIVSPLIGWAAEPPWEYEWNADEVPRPGPDYHYRGVLIARHETSPVISRPTDGVEYVVGDTIGDSEAVYLGVGSPFFNWWWNWWDMDVVLGDTYYYKLFSRDESWNYSTGVETEGLIPVITPTPHGYGLTTPTPIPFSAVRNACLSPDVELVSTWPSSQGIRLAWIGPRDLVGWFCDGSECCAAGGGIVLLDTNSPPGPRKSYYYKAADFITPSVHNYTVEFRMKVVDSSSLDGRLRFRTVALGNDEHARILELDFSNTQVRMSHPPNVFNLDTTDDFHIYRIVGRGNTGALYIDGRLMDQGSLNEAMPKYEGIYFGDSIGGGSQSQWDYIKYTSGAYPYPTPSPSPSASPSPYLVALDSGDYDGDGLADPAVFRPDQGLWIIRSLGRLYFGRPGDLPAPGDYDGDGITDPAYYRPTVSLWSVKDQTRVYFGASPQSLPAPADYNGDGTCDLSVFDPTVGLWMVPGQTRAWFGRPGDLPVPEDYDGDGSADMAYFRETSGFWNVRGQTKFYLGQEGDLPVPGLYHWNLPQISFPAVFRPSQGLWIVRGLTRYYFGLPGDIPLRGSFTPGFLEQPACFRSSRRLWKIMNGSRIYFGQEGDIPITR